MYCPTCAARLADAATHCAECGRDMRPIVQALRYQEPAAARHAERLAAAQARRWKQQRHSWGMLLVMCSLLVGCLIPISLGLFSGFEMLGPIVVALAGLAGLLLIAGSMLLMAADGEILVGDDQSTPPADDEARPHTGQTSRLSAPDTASTTRYDEPAAYVASR